jgi:hypothetical protein
MGSHAHSVKIMLVVCVFSASPEALIALCSQTSPYQHIICPVFNLSTSPSTHCLHMLLQCLVGLMRTHESLGTCDNSNKETTHLLVKRARLPSTQVQIE